MATMYGLLTKCEVKMAGYWPSSFFVCLWTKTKSRSINSQKKNEANIQPSWPNKLCQWRIYYMAFGEFFLQDTAGSPEWARWLHLARSGSQSQLAIWFILPAHGASHIIKHHLAHLCSQSQHKVQFILLAWGTCLTIIHINAWDSKHGIINHFKATCHPVI